MSPIDYGANNGMNKSSDPISQPKWILEMMIGFSQIASPFPKLKIDRKIWPRFLFFPLNSVIATATTADPDALCSPVTMNIHSIDAGGEKLAAPIDSIKNLGFPRSCSLLFSIP